MNSLLERVLKCMYDGPPRPSNARIRWYSTASEGHRTVSKAFQNTFLVRLLHFRRPV